MAVKVFDGKTLLGKVKHDEKLEINVNGEMNLKFRCTIRSTTCHVKAGDQVVLSFNRLTGGLNATVTSEAGLQETIEQNRVKDYNKAYIIGVIIILWLIIKHGFLR